MHEKVMRERDDLQKSLDANKRTSAIDLKNAKLKSKEMFEKMLEDRINACTLAYSEEFEILAR
jgi:hypothetical protein